MVSGRRATQQHEFTTLHIALESRLGNWKTGNIFIRKCPSVRKGSGVDQVMLTRSDKQSSKLATIVLLLMLPQSLRIKTNRATAMTTIIAEVVLVRRHSMHISKVSCNNKFVYTQTKVKSTSARVKRCNILVAQQANKSCQAKGYTCAAVLQVQMYVCVYKS